MNFLIIGLRFGLAEPPSPRIRKDFRHERPNHPDSRARPSSMPSGCRSPPTASSRAIRACLTRAEGMHYWTADGRQVLDAVAGLWCVNAGHGRREITEAVRAAARHHGIRPGLPDGPSRSHSSSRIGWRRSRRPDMDRVFFTNSGSESVDTALKIAIAYHRARGAGPAHPAHRPREGLSRRRLRRHVGRRHGQQSQILRGRAAAGRGSFAAHARYRAQRLLARPAALGHASRERAGAAHRAARRLDHRRRHRRAHCRFGRRDVAARRDT